MKPFSIRYAHPLFSFFKHPLSIGCCCILLLAWGCPLAFGQTGNDLGKIEVAVTPTPHIPIFKEVAILPFQHANNTVDKELTDIFSQALDKTKKYHLIAPARSNRYNQAMATIPGRFAGMQERAFSFGKSAGIRGVITGTIATDAYASGDFSAPTKQKAITIFINMTDIQHSMPVWTLTLSTLPPSPVNNSPHAQLPALIQKGVKELIDHLVSRGDIFSTRLPVPQVISKEVIGNRIQITIQPDTEAIYSSYQLLRSDGRDTAFSLIQSPKSNTGALLTLSDYNQKNHETSYYSVIGITRSGLANVPAPPFTAATPDRPLLSHEQRVDSITTHPES